MKVVLLKFAYPEYLRDYARRFPSAARAPYAEQARFMAHDSFWWGDAWSAALAPLGHEVDEIIMNAEGMQKAWAGERGIPVPHLGWMLPILRRQLIELAPDVLFVQSFRGVDAAFLREAREFCPSLRKILGWRGSPPLRTELHAACDVMLSCVPEIVTALEQQGHRCVHLDHAFDPRVLERVGPAPTKTIDVSFAGSTEEVLQHGERESFLRLVGRRLPLHLFSHRRDRGAVRLVKTLGGQVLWAAFRTLSAAGVSRAWLQTLPQVGRVASWARAPRFRPSPVPPDRHHSAVYGLPMYQTLLRSKVTLNAHSSISPRSASNLRLFEATGVGTCVLTDHKRNLAEHFADDEIVSYRSAAECIDKATWLLDHPEAREQIAAAGQRRVLRDHKFSDRAPILDRLLRSF